MDCNVIRDLLPLYADGVCSEKSRELVDKHISECKACKDLLVNMQKQIEEPAAAIPAPTFKREKIALWKASLLQLMLMLSSFLILTVGVAREAKTTLGDMNGYWAFTLVLPAAGFLLSLANWYFVRLYRTRRMFVTASAGITALVMICANIWGLYHYEYFGYLKTMGDFGMFLFSWGTLFSLFLCVVSAIGAYYYTDFIGKE